MRYFIYHLALISAIHMSVFLACQQTQAEKVALPAADADTTVEVIAPPSLQDTLQSILNLDYIMGRFDPSKHPHFVLIDSQYADRNNMYLRKDAYEAFLAMYRHALKDGITLQIRSATRNFYAQKSIWEGKWTGERLIEGGENLALSTPEPKQRALKILRFSSMPGSSRHHWGTDIDLNNFDNSWFAEGKGLDMYKWLQANAPGYGFCQPYTEGRPYGYFEERWHWSYMPVSTRLTQYAKENLKDNMIEGFLGSETAKEIGIVEKYVLGISQDCLLQ